MDSNGGEGLIPGEPVQSQRTEMRTSNDHKCKKSRAMDRHKSFPPRYHSYSIALVGR